MGHMEAVVFSFVSSEAGLEYEYIESCEGDWFKLKSKGSEEFAYIKVIDRGRKSPIGIPYKNKNIFLLVGKNNDYNLYSNQHSKNDFRIEVRDVIKNWIQIEPSIVIRAELKERYKKLRNLYDSDSEKKSGFGSFNRFYDWWLSQYALNDRRCKYCQVEEHKVRELIKCGGMRSRKSRGLVLEVDRKNPNVPYSKDNCNLVCYFCNNDKSNIFNEEEYLRFFQRRKEYIDDLYEKKAGECPRKP